MLPAVLLSPSLQSADMAPPEGFNIQDVTSLVILVYVGVHNRFGDGPLARIPRTAFLVVRIPRLDNPPEVDEHRPSAAGIPFARVI
jgi:hypothetical protein